MNETDDRLVGDPVWELLPAEPDQATSLTDFLTWLALGVFIVAAWALSPPIAILTACLTVPAKDFRRGRRIARSIPDKAGARICAWFTYAWGFWKLAIAAFIMIFVSGVLSAASGPIKEPPPAALTAMMLWLGGLVASAAFSVAGLILAFRSGMRVWIGEGVKRARVLLLAMMIVGFTVFVLGPWMLWLTGSGTRARGGTSEGIAMLAGLGCMFGGPVVILILLDWFNSRVIADSPGKFGPKVPAVGKWKP